MAQIEQECAQEQPSVSFFASLIVDFSSWLSFEAKI
jgi:hypothetical protein